MKVVVEWNIAADESVEEDPQGPDGGRLAVIAAVQQPLGGGVHPGTWNSQIWPSNYNKLSSLSLLYR